MKSTTRLSLLFATALVLLVPIGCDFDARLDRLEQDSRLLQSQVDEQARQRESTDADVAQQILAINERQDSTNQRLVELETKASNLATSVEELRQQITEVDSQLDDRAINWAVKHPLTYFVGILLVLIGIAIGVWGVRWKERKDKRSSDEQDAAPTS